MRGVETEGHFQPPAGGAIGESQYEYMYAVREESWASLWSLEKIGQCMLKLSANLCLSKHTKFEAVNIKSEGGVRSNARCRKRQNGTNLHVQFKMADFRWTRRHDVKRLFCTPAHDEGVQWISSKLTPTKRVFSESVGGATESLWSNVTMT